MQTAQGNMLLSLRTAKEFLDEHADKLAGVSKTGYRQRLDNAIAALEGDVTDQSGSALAAQGATNKQRTLRTALLRDHMAKIARIAKADLPQTPELASLRMPRGKPTIERLAAAANGMAKEAAAHTDVFIAAGLPGDFITQLNEASRAMVASLSDRVKSRGRRKGATTGLRSKLTAGRKIVHVLDAFVQSALHDDPVLIASWNLVKRVHRTRVRSTHVTPAPAPTGSGGTPITPASPVAPDTPATPVAPDTPVTPVTSVTPVPPAAAA